MSKSFSTQIPAHNSIYSENHYNNYSDRKLRVDYSVPNEVNEETGILLLIAGYGGNIDSNVYKKMRNLFSDNYNLIVLQCSYFGSEFMQTPSSGELTNIYNDLNVIKKASKLVNGKSAIKIFCEINENLDNMNDMGPMQAIDNITAVLFVIEEAKKNGIEVNAKKIIIYGQSHGAYLAYLCNRFRPNMFSLIIENSAYIFPSYLDTDRILITNNFYLVYSYMVANFKNSISLDLYSLPYLYENFENSCNIICYHGIDDNMTSYEDKYEFANRIKKMIFMGIGNEDLTGDVVKSTDHGLNADFIKLFDISYQAIEAELQSKIEYDLPEKVEIFLYNSKSFVIDYKTGVPICSFKKGD